MGNTTRDPTYVVICTGGGFYSFNSYRLLVNVVIKRGLKLSIKVKIKLSLCLSKHHAIKT